MNLPDELVWARLAPHVPEEELLSLKALPIETVKTLYQEVIVFGQHSEAALSVFAFVRKVVADQGSTQWQFLRVMIREGLMGTYFVVSNGIPPESSSLLVELVGDYVQERVNGSLDALAIQLGLIWNLLPLQELGASEKAISSQREWLPQLMAVFNEEGEELQKLLPLLNLDEYQAA